MTAEVYRKGFGPPTKAFVTNHKAAIKFFRKIVRFKASLVKIQGFSPLPCFLPVTP